MIIIITQVLEDKLKPRGKYKMRRKYFSIPTGKVKNNIILYIHIWTERGETVSINCYVISLYYLLVYLN